MIRWLISVYAPLFFPLFFGIGMGPSDAEKKDASAFGGISNFGVTQGESAITSSNNFWQGILSGDPTQISKVLGPLFSTVNKQGQQAKKTTAEFGNRGGGTNAVMQSVDDKTRGTLDSAVAGLTGSAASSLGASGAGLLNTGLSARGEEFSADKTIHDQNSAKINDIIKSAVSVAAAPFTGGASLTGLASSGGGGGGGGGFSNPFSHGGSFGMDDFDDGASTGGVTSTGIAGAEFS